VAVGRMLKFTGLSLFDRLLGAAFGVVRGVLIGVALILGLMAFTPGGTTPTSVVHSRMSPYVVDAARIFASMAPHELKEGFRKSYAQVKLAWSKAVDKGLHGVRDGDKKENERKI
jgi:membrane protein required for colicin V production